MSEDEKYPWTETDDLHDTSFLTNRKCPKCGSRIISHPECRDECSNDECDYSIR